MDVLRRYTLKTTAIVLLVLASALVSPPPVQAMDADQVRALFVSRLVKYMDWPEEPSPDQPIVVAAADAHSLRSMLKDSDHIKVVQWPTEFCHALYFNAGTRREINAVLQSLKDKPVLTIGTTDSFLEQGGMVNLKQVDHRLRLEINTKATARAGLGVSSRLMAVSLRHGQDRPGQAAHGEPNLHEPGGQGQLHHAQPPGPPGLPGPPPGNGREASYPSPLQVSCPATSWRLPHPRHRPRQSHLRTDMTLVMAPCLRSIRAGNRPPRGDVASALPPVTPNTIPDTPLMVPMVPTADPVEALEDRTVVPVVPVEAQVVVPEVPVVLVVPMDHADRAVIRAAVPILPGALHETICLPASRQ